MSEVILRGRTRRQAIYLSIVGSDRKLDKAMNVVLYTNGVLDFRIGITPTPYTST